MFIDIHTHLIPGVDDGSENSEMTADMLKIAVREGTEGIALTPHYVRGFYENSKESLNGAAEAVKELADKAGLKVEIYSGNEIHIDNNLIELIERDVVYTINGSRYLLIELPMLEMPHYVNETIFRLLLKGYIPVIAHPERNVIISRDLRVADKLAEQGALLQLNGESINGGYGRAASKCAFEMIKRGIACFVASDAHSNTRRTPGLSKAFRNVADTFDTRTAKGLFYDNPLKVVMNETF